MKNGEPRSLRKPRKRIELGGHIVADPQICHGKPTFKGTCIMVWQVLEDVAGGRSWDFICNVRWAGRLPLTAVGEAVRLALRALLDERGEGQWRACEREPASDEAHRAES
jgi:uncharacterized protein (DUF433 family)